MGAINDGGPVFPVPETVDQDGDFRTQSDEQGMTLRDYFAAMAMQAIVAKHGVLSCNADVPQEEGTERREIWGAGEKDDHCHLGTATIAFEIADAMLAARNRKSD